MIDKNSNLAWNLVLLTLGAGILFVVGWLFIRRFRPSSYEDTQTEAFTLEDLRRMRERGQINEVEYQSMRGAIISELRADTKRATPPKAGI